MCLLTHPSFLLIFFIDTATTEIYTLSLHDALPIYARSAVAACLATFLLPIASATVAAERRSEEHTSELQSHSDLVCRLLLEKKKDKIPNDSQYELELRTWM